MSDVPDTIYLLTCRPTCYDTSEEARQWVIYDSWEKAEVLTYFTCREDAEAEMERLYESHNYEVFGPPKQVLAIAEVRMG